MVIDSNIVKNKKMYDVVIVGAGPAGIFTAYELVYEKHFNGSILIIDKGKSIHRRFCPMRKKPDTPCAHCEPCNIMTGFGGAGTFSDCKLSLYPVGVGGDVADYIGEDEAVYLANKVDNILANFDIDRNKRVVVGNTEQYKQMVDLYTSEELKLLYCPTKHLGTDGTLLVMRSMFEALDTTPFVHFMFETDVETVNFDPDSDYTLICHNNNDSFITVNAHNVVIAPGRVGNSWAKKIANDLGITTTSKYVDIGVRVETETKITKNVTDNLYDMKFYAYNNPFGYKVRTFCTNPRGFVSEEHYHDGCAVANGHSFANKKSNMTNFAVLVNIADDKFTPETATKLMEYINMYSKNKLVCSRLIDDGINKQDTRTLKSALITNIDNLLPNNVMISICNFLGLLDSVCMPGLYSNRTWLYAPEIKFYSDSIKVDSNFMSDYSGLYFIGDGSGITRGIIQSAITGIKVADNISQRFS